MSTTRLPPAPEPKFHEDYGPHGNHFNYHTADQMHAYGLAVWKAAMATGIETCQQYESKMWQAFKQGPNAGERGSAYVEGLSDGAGECAERLLALPLPELAGSPQERRE